MRKLDRRQVGTVALLSAIVAVAAFLRFDALGEPSYWLDEVLGQRVMRNAAALPFWAWLDGVHPQHGPLYYATQLLASLAGDDEWAGRLAAAAFGLAAIPMLFLAARRATGDNLGAAVSALLLAVSPLHVYYSREARPYALLVLLTIAGLFAIVSRSRVMACAVLVLLLYTSLASASALAAILCAVLWSGGLLARRPDRFTGLWLVAAAAVLALALLPVLYHAEPSDRVEAPFPGFTPRFFDGIVRGLAVTALEGRAGGRAAYAMLLFAVIGAVALFRRNRAHAAAVLTLALVPIVVSVTALAAENHFFAMRYVIAALPGYLILCGAGIAAVARRVPKIGPAVALAVAVVIAAQSWHAARTEPFRKLDWRQAASTIVRYAKPGDLVLSAEPWSGIILDYYLDRLPKKVEDVTMTIQPLAERMTNDHPAAWLVSGGFSSDTAVRSWFCTQPLVLGSALEGFRVHYASRSGGDFLRERSGPAEWRALDAALGANGVTLEMNGREELLLGEGWEGAEGSGADTFRWTTGERATVLLPRWGKRDRVLRMRVHPLDHPSLPRQTMRVELNGRTLETLTLAPATEERTLVVPAAAWVDGINTLTFVFGRAVAPADVDPSNGDRRLLAVAFDELSVLDRGVAAGKPVGTLSVRLANVFLDEHTAWRGTKTRFPPERQKHDAVAALLGRLGFDPLITWPRLQRGDLRLEDLADTIAYGSDCESDRDFALRMYGILFERVPNGLEEQSLLGKLRGGTSRSRLIAHIVKSDEFRAKVLRP